MMLNRSALLTEKPHLPWIRLILKPRKRNDADDRKDKRIMDYLEWADEYYLNAGRVKSVIERKKLLLKEKKSLTADQRKRLTDDIKQYRRIYHELLDVGDILVSRAERCRTWDMRECFWMIKTSRWSPFTCIIREPTTDLRENGWNVSSAVRSGASWPTDSANVW